MHTIRRHYERGSRARSFREGGHAQTKRRFDGFAVRDPIDKSKQ